MYYCYDINSLAKILHLVVICMHVKTLSNPKTAQLLKKGAAPVVKKDVKSKMVAKKWL